MARLPHRARARVRGAAPGWARLGLVVVLAAAVLLAAPGSAWAGAGLIAADPPDGAVLAAAPAAVALTFSAVPDPALSHVSTRDGAGQEVGNEEPTRAGRTGLRLAVSIRSAGDYTIAYHVVFDDGSAAFGLLRFSVGTGVAPRELSGDALQQAQDAVAVAHDHSVDPLSAVLLIADLAVLVGVVLLLLRPRARPWPDAAAQAPTDDADPRASA